LRASIIAIISLVIAATSSHSRERGNPQRRALRTFNQK
jgi:hypothetical protein